MPLDSLVAGTGTGGSESKRVFAAILFMQSANMSMQFYGTLNSSPWTAENFGADQQKAASCREYVHHAIVSSVAWGAASAAIAHSVWPLLGAIVINAYLYWLYMRALERGKVAGSDGWANP